MAGPSSASDGERVVPVTLEQLLAQPDFHLRLRAGAEPGTPALREPLAWAHSSDLQDPTPWLRAGGLLLTDGTQFDSDGETAWADGYVGRLVAAGVAALGFATKVGTTRFQRGS
jgi:PucR family transcriptional regulator, purine catabolism regulatory protein